MASDKKNKRKETPPRDKVQDKVSGSFQKKTTLKKTESVNEREQVRLFDKTITKAKEIINYTLDYVTDLNKRFDPVSPIYIQIHANNIYKIFSSALISPQYSEKNENIFPDVQSINPEVLLLSNGFIARVEERNILLEVLLTRDEILQLEVTGGIAVFRLPLPVSRIKRVLVENQALKAEILNTSLSGDGGIIPEKLFGFFDKQQHVFELPELIPGKSEEMAECRMFDKILGAFSYLANYNILLANKTNQIKTLPDHFLLAAKVVNNNYKLDFENERVSNFYRILFRLNKEEQPLLQWLVNRVYEGSNFTDNDVITFVSELSRNAKPELLPEAKDIFNGLMRSLERKKAIREIPNLNHNEKFYLYLFAVLRQYGNLNSEDKTISRADLPEFIFPAYGEYTFACLGFFYGYKSLRNFEERLSLNDKLFSDVFQTERRINLKFKLNTTLDLSLIESVYQYCFNGKVATDQLDYSKLPFVQNELNRKPQNLSDLYEFNGKVFYGKALYSIRKKSPIDQIEKLLESVVRIPSISNLGASCYRKKIRLMSLPLMELAETEPKYYLYFNKADIFTAVKTNVLNADDVLKDVISGLAEREF